MSTTTSNLQFFKHAESIAKIDSDLRALESCARQLRAERNRLIPVGELPAEILTRIFGLVLADSEKTATADVLPITWVSHHWRDVAISYPTLWTRIDKSCYSWLDECLRRSGLHHLSISVISKKEKDKAALKRTFDEAFSRIASLAVLSPRTDHGGPQALPFSCNQPAPYCLHSLDLAGHAIPYNLLPGPVTQTRHLALFDCNFTCNMLHRFTGLTHLTIQRPTIGISVSEILGVLSVTPRLQAVILARVFDLVDVDYSGATLPSPSIPNLTSLELKDENYAPILQLLQHTTIPDLVSLRIHIHVGNITASDLSSLLNVVNHRFPASRPIRALAMEAGKVDYSANISLHFYASPSWNENEGCLKIGIGVYTNSFCSGSEPWFAAALRDLPLDSVQTLYLTSSYDELPPDICESALFLLQNVKVFHLEGYFANIITEKLQESAGQSPQNTVFPAMEKLVLGDWNLVPQELLLSDFSISTAMLWIYQLKEMITKRRAVTGQMVDLAMEDVVEAPCVFGKFEADEDYPVSDTDSD